MEDAQAHVGRKHRATPRRTTPTSGNVRGGRARVQLSPLSGLRLAVEPFAGAITERGKVDQIDAVDKSACDPFAVQAPQIDHRGPLDRQIWLQVVVRIHEGKE